MTNTRSPTSISNRRSPWIRLIAAAIILASCGSTPTSTSDAPESQPHYFDAPGGLSCKEDVFDRQTVVEETTSAPTIDQSLEKFAATSPLFDFTPSLNAATPEIEEHDANTATAIYRRPDQTVMLNVTLTSTGSTWRVSSLITC